MFELGDGTGAVFAQSIAPEANSIIKDNKFGFGVNKIGEGARIGKIPYQNKRW